MSGPGRIEVRRTGGFAGLSVSGSLDLAQADDPGAAEARALVDELDFAAAGPTSAGRPDGFVYHFDVDGQQLSLPESTLTDGQRRLARLVLDR